MENAIFDFYPTQKKAIGLVSAPHSGEIIPAEFEPFLTSDQKARGRDVDYKTRELLDIKALNDAGIHVIVANIHRICVDLNRSEDLCIFAWPNNSHGETLMTSQPSIELQQSWREKYYEPYFEFLKSIIQNLNKSLPGTAPVIDFHSMPSSPTAYHLSVTPDQPAMRPTFCLSNLKGISSSEAFINHFKESLEQEYEDVSLNYPYYGGYLTQYINTLDTQNFQIEVRRNLYMDESKRELIDQHKKVKALVNKSLIKLFQDFPKL